MKWITIYALFAFNLAAAQPDARSIIEQSNEKIKSLKSINLDVLYSDQHTGEITADVIISREQQTYPVFGVSKFKMS
ncbi:MAG TPA: hypothetical protein VEA37_00205, partial [Flavobacterium sp.]|nr:hypothetical protein [Flavobacterium sp.]